MVTKANIFPTIAIVTVAAFLLITFWRNNLSVPSYSYTNDGDKTKSASKGNSGHVQQVTVTVTAPAAAAPTSSVQKASSGGASKKDKPRFIFVDLGANGADSLETFLQHPEAKLKYEFPSPSWATHEDAEIFLFEANPVFNDHLVNAKQKYGALGKEITIYPSTVVDTKDGIRTFYLDKVNTDNAYWGSSTLKNHPDAIASGGKGTDLSAINISRWLLMNTLPQDFVVVKMDIEGAEYEILPHMAEMRVWTVVDHLLIEWHDNLPTEEMRQEATKGMEKLKKEGVNCPHYDSAT